MTDMSAEYQRRYLAAVHAMQSGVAMEMQESVKSIDPKHLRVGVNSAMTDHGSLVRLLMAKGVFTEEEYFQAIAEGMEAEVRRYEESLSELLGMQIMLL